MIYIVLTADSSTPLDPDAMKELLEQHGDINYAFIKCHHVAVVFSTLWCKRFQWDAIEVSEQCIESLKHSQEFDLVDWMLANPDVETPLQDEVINSLPEPHEEPEITPLQPEVIDSMPEPQEEPDVHEEKGWFGQFVDYIDHLGDCLLC